VQKQPGNPMQEQQSLSQLEQLKRMFP